ncbi:hypothetical protein THASP1DRAFT_31372 [Thamnocephalis sphaerospora]|uniref:Uncharacterized protein n=1 Tax=Thamnocephalis sphaerospora TaxID=78915 RepID=A0A4P9XLV8_9FUNG|nr:hypothetical protein THASP1DRAFT_31372 [Thamnocephalis sphaerospora]|eukprot:RKP06812.1 hypothetical protein THASP1DRAFT_31372 [Thamnocephalis sphaerospora]
MSSEPAGRTTINGFEYIVLASGDLDEIALPMVIARRNQPVQWICLVQAVSGVIFGAMLISISLPGDSNCQMLVWTGVPLMTISLMCADVVLVMKAYVAHGRLKPLLYLGAFMVMLQFVPSALILRKTKLFMTTSYACATDAPAYYPWLRLGLDLPINILFLQRFSTLSSKITRAMDQMPGRD